MKRKSGVGLTFSVEQSLLEHDFGTAPAFFSGLKHEPHAARQVFTVSMQKFGSGCQHGGMGIVST